LSLLRLQRGLSCEGANIRPVRRPLQHACHEFMAKRSGAATQAVDRKGKSARQIIIGPTNTPQLASGISSSSFSDA
jgi:hypothetical protein